LKTRGLRRASLRGPTPQRGGCSPGCEQTDRKTNQSTTSAGAAGALPPLSAGERRGTGTRMTMSG